MKTDERALDPIELGINIGAIVGGILYLCFDINPFMVIIVGGGIGFIYDNFK